MKERAERVYVRAREDGGHQGNKTLNLITDHINSQGLCTRPIWSLQQVLCGHIMASSGIPDSANEWGFFSCAFSWALSLLLPLFFFILPIPMC